VASLQTFVSRLTGRPRSRTHNVPRPLMDLHPRHNARSKHSIRACLISAALAAAFLLFVVPRRPHRSADHAPERGHGAPARLETGAVFVLYSGEDAGLLRQTVRSLLAAGWRGQVLVLDNSPGAGAAADAALAAAGAAVLRTSGSLGYAQLQNVAASIALERGLAHYFWAHPGALVLGPDPLTSFRAAAERCAAAAAPPAAPPAGPLAGGRCSACAPPPGAPRACTRTRRTGASPSSARTASWRSGARWPRTCAGTCSSRATAPTATSTRACACRAGACSTAAPAAWWPPGRRALRARGRPARAAQAAARPAPPTRVRAGRGAACAGGAMRRPVPAPTPRSDNADAPAGGGRAV